MTERATSPSRITSASPVLVFTGTIFLSAALLFFVQPLYARIVLPVLGGAPAVWTTAMLFFQSVLIAGYLYAHLMIRYVPPPVQLLIHMTLWATALFFLPLALPEGWSPDPNGSAALQTLMAFAVGVGVPFAVLSANAPLLQAWYTRSGGPSSDDPYFLYAASNLGSLIALMAFPLVAEPLFGATAIGFGFAIGFGLLGIGLLLSGRLGLRVPVTRQVSEATGGTITLPQVLAWLLFAFVPSSMMLAVTSKISTDVGSIPLIWVVPLALYLLTFVITFGDRFGATSPRLRLVALPSLLWLAYVLTGGGGNHLSFWQAGGMLAAFFGLALFAHRRLYEARPSGGHLTLFYLVMSVGGALGGLFNSIVAPNLFSTLLEGNVTVIAGFLLLLPARLVPSPRQTVILALYVTCAALVLWSLPTVFGIEGRTLILGAMGLLVGGSIVVFAARLVPVAIAAPLIVLAGQGALPNDRLFQDRSFFGVHRVVDEESIRKYINGTTLHGQQFLSDLDAERPQPLAYYHENGPLAAVFLDGPGPSAERVGIVGLGVGALACYATPGQDWHFYEIDPMVDQVARDTDLFTFVSTCTPDAPTHLGDARRVLADQSSMDFDVLVLDAYSSDAVPVHLTTLEAVDLYMSHLDEDGVLVFHISNRYFKIDIPLAEIARARGLSAGIIKHIGTDAPGDNTTIAVFLAREEAHFGALTSDPEWSDLSAGGGPLWTDDYANPLSVLKWRN